MPFGVFPIPKLWNYVTFSVFVNNAIKSVPIDSYSSGFIPYTPSFILGKLFIE